MKHMVFQNTDIGDAQAQIDDLAALGWVLLGPVQVSIDSLTGNNLYVTTMAKLDE